jgi:hypothetical protein
MIPHYNLLGKTWIEAMATKMHGRINDALVYSKYRAPVAIVRDGEQMLDAIIVRAASCET